MSGNIRRSGAPDWWIASSGTYYWVLGYLASTVTDEAVAEEFRAAVTHGFRTIDLDTLTEGQRREVLDLIRGPLVPAVAARFPGPDGEAVRKFVGELEKVARTWADRG
jgi:hypothetical protein